MSSRCEAATAIAPVADVLGELLDLPLTPDPAPPRRSEGIALGRLDGVDPDGSARVSSAALALTGVRALSTVRLSAERIGARVALGFAGGDPRQPILLGFLIEGTSTAPASGSTLPTHERDGRLLIEAQGELELRCGEARVLLCADGSIHLRGRRITSHAKGAQRIRGGSVQIN